MTSQWKQIWRDIYAEGMSGIRWEYHSTITGKQTHIFWCLEDNRPTNLGENENDGTLDWTVICHKNEGTPAEKSTASSRNCKQAVAVVKPFSTSITKNCFNSFSTQFVTSENTCVLQSSVYVGKTIGHEVYVYLL